MVIKNVAISNIHVANVMDKINTLKSTELQCPIMRKKDSVDAMNVDQIWAQHQQG
jgi:hypothetical protein